MADKVKVDTINWKKVAADYAYAGSLVNANPSLKEFFKELAGIMRASGGRPITQQEFDRVSRKYEWFQQHDSNQQAAELAKANFPEDYKESVSRNADSIRELAAQLGVPVDEDTVQSLAEQARYNQWDPEQTRKNLEPFLANATGDLTGQAGDIQTNLKQWAAQNGLSLTDQQLQAYVSAATFNKQSIDDIKADLRKSYLAGMFPAWADKIEAGYDPSTLFAPYLKSAQDTLETMVGFDDPLMKRITQAVGPDGKPRAVPLYEAERMMRQDPRWQKTDNAYKTYAGVAQDILRTFGFA